MFAHSKGEVGKDYSRIAVLVNLSKGTLYLLKYRLYILLVNKRCKLLAKGSLLAPEVAHLRKTSMDHKRLAQQATKVQQHTPLVLTTQRRDIICPVHQLKVLIVVAQAHNGAERVKVLAAQAIICLTK